MKNFRLQFLLVAFAFLTVFSACKKDDEPSGKTKEDLLTGKKWKMTAATIDPAILGISDWYAQMEECEKDNFTEFKKGGQAVFDEASNRCDGEPQTATGSWIFNSDQTKITITELNEDPITFDIVELNDNTLKIKYSERDADTNINYTISASYTKI